MFEILEHLPYSLFQNYNKLSLFYDVVIVISSLSSLNVIFVSEL